MTRAPLLQTKAPPTAKDDVDHSGVALGSVLVSLLEPERGREAAFHRWYERDHFYAGCMVVPWFFAGRRFVATRELKALREPQHTPLMDDVRLGSYLALYWMLAGHHADAVALAVEQVTWLNENGRMLAGRIQAHAGFYGHRWSVSRDADGVPAELALHHPFPGLVVLMLDRHEGVSQEAIDAWLREVYLPDALAGSAAALCLASHPFPLPDDAPSYVRRLEGLERRSMLLFFLDEDPRTHWRDLFGGVGERVAASGLGELTWLAPFIPTLPGSDRYADELW